MRYFAGVDGAGNRTLAVVVNEHGQEIGMGVADGANYRDLMTNGFSAREAATLVARRIGQAISQALSQKQKSVNAVYAGLAGANHSEDVALLRDVLVEAKYCPPNKLQVVNDAELVLCGLENGQGIGLVSGLGSIALGRNRRNRMARAGGWGYLFGDEGSAYYIGQLALQAATQSADGRGPATKLLQLIMDEWKINRSEKLMDALYDAPEGRLEKIGRLTKPVFQAAQAGDTVAKEITLKAADELARAAWSVYRQLDFAGEGEQPNPPLGMGGNLLLNMPEYRSAVLDRLARLGYSPSRQVLVPNSARAAALACMQAEMVRA
ncbi:MAG TPA: BadF/BadG/BcrA/BcrD ATPase family protein [Chloroflexia bacterium]|nr:BadF/BadG/BcrA/BcrD ATPase family protein [Chloroflexia bacterium]